MDRQELNGLRIFVIRDFLTPEECDRFIDLSEVVRYQDAPISTLGGFVMHKGIRDNARVMIDDPAIAETLGERARPLLPPTWSDWELVGLNERFRFYRYDPGQKFKAHFDGYFERPNGERSHFTFMVYLNDGFEGGPTAFYECDPVLRVQPERGKALVFFHHQLHEGMPVVSGRKYVLRTDVMYRRQEGAR
jgi:hypothetical protein